MAWDVVGQDSTGNLSVVADPPPTGYHILPGSGGPYPTKPEAEAALKALNKVITTPEPLIPGTNIQVPSLPNPLSGIEAVGNFFNKLGEASTWLRIGEFILGLLLLTVGIAKITDTVPIATKLTKAMAL